MSEVLPDRNRAAKYWTLGLGLTAALLAGHLVPSLGDWQGSAELHTLMEAVATLLAVLVGIMALTRYYSKKETIFLFVGAGFLGTGFLDGYHAVVTSVHFWPFMPSDNQSLLPWSWVASRQFLSMLLFFSWLVWLREQKAGARGVISERNVYLGVGVFTLASFLFFALTPLPVAYFPVVFFHRPEEFGPALFFLLALIGYIRKGKWRKDPFEHWLVMSLIVGLISQSVFISHSGALFDYEFDVAHMLKKLSYVFVLTGLLISMYVALKRDEQSVVDLARSEERVRAVVENIRDGIITIDELGFIQSVNKAAERIFLYSSEVMIGRNVSTLAAEPYRSAHDGYLHNYVSTGRATIIGTGREVEGERSDGSKFPMYLEVAELSVGSERLFLGVVRDITESKEVDRLKSEFVSTVSHELRTPLTSIKGSLGMVKSGALSDPEQINSMIGLAANNTERLINLVNDLLDMEKLQAGRMEFDFAEVELSKLIDEALEVNQPYAAEYNVEFAYADGDADARVTGDAHRLMQVLSNLLSNAAKFSPSGGVIRVSMIAGARSVRVEVADDGLGIPETFRERIFERFTQADSADSRQKGGTGLGLSISQAIIEKHGGGIGFDSREGGGESREGAGDSQEGAGTTFYFELPLAADDDGQSDTPVSLASASTNAELQIDDGNPDVARILHVEDDLDLCRVMQAMIGNSMNLQCATSLREGRVEILRRRYDLIILDPGLPDGNALDLLEDIKASDNAATPVIIYSSAEFERRPDGVARVLLKSKSSNRDLLETIAALIEKD